MEPTKKEFKPKNNIPQLSDYSVSPDESFWSEFPSVTWEEAKLSKCKIDYKLLYQLGIQEGYPDENRLSEACKDLEEGARLGVSPSYYMNSTSTNAISAIQYGYEVTDALADWLQHKYAMGPFNIDQVPFNMTRISGLMTKIKPNGSVRIILNLSKGKPSAVNDGINKANYKTIMSSNKAWIRILWRCGMDCRFCKLDWSSAYKVGW